MLLQTAIALFAGITFAANVCAQDASKIPRVGLLLTSATSSPHLAQAFKEGMRAQGFVEDRDVRYEPRYHDGNRERMESQARGLASAKVSLILAMNTPTALAAQKATRSIPVVFSTVGNPVEAGLVASLAAPGANITGFSLQNPGLRAKRVEILHDIDQKLRRMGILYDAQYLPIYRASLQDVEKAALGLGKETLAVDVGTPEKFSDAFAALEKWGAQTVFVLESTRIHNHRRTLLERVATNRWPSVTATRDFAEAGALISYGADYVDLNRRAGEYAARILRGAKPSELPVQQPTKFEMVVNLKTAKALGISVPQQVLLRADRVIE